MTLPSIAARTVLIGLLALGSEAALAGTAEDDFIYRQALEFYGDGHWSAAFGRFAALAERGHPDAARIALMMVRYGPELYRSAWTVTPGQLVRWQEAAEAAGHDHTIAPLGEFSE